MVKRWVWFPGAGVVRATATRLAKCGTARARFFGNTHRGVTTTAPFSAFCFRTLVFRTSIGAKPRAPMNRESEWPFDKLRVTRVHQEAWRLSNRRIVLILLRRRSIA